MLVLEVCCASQVEDRLIAIQLFCTPSSSLCCLHSELQVVMIIRFCHHLMWGPPRVAMLSIGSYWLLLLLLLPLPLPLVLQEQ